MRLDFWPRQRYTFYPGINPDFGSIPQMSSAKLFISNEERSSTPSLRDKGASLATPNLSPSFYPYLTTGNSHTGESESESESSMRENWDTNIFLELVYFLEWISSIDKDSPYTFVARFVNKFLPLRNESITKITQAGFLEKEKQ